MFESLSGRLNGIFERLGKRGALTESDVTAAMREVRTALLEADVALPVVKDFVEAVREKAVGQEVLRSVSPAQMVVKVVHDHLVEALGAEAAGIDTGGEPPAAVLVVGLQGSGKTTTAAKLALRLKSRERKKVLLASLDVYRPAAQQQLQVLGRQADVPVLDIVLGERPVAICERAMRTGRLEGYDVVVLDTAGRLHIDAAMMAEVAAVRDAARPTETLLVADAMTGQDAVNLAREFHARVGVTGIALTRADGDARGGAALSMRAETGRPLKLLGTGEKLDALEVVDARRIAGRILGMGDVVGLVERAQEVVEREDGEKMAARMMKGEFTLDDLARQLGQIRRMGSVEGLLGMLPGIAKVKKQLSQHDIDDRMLVRQQAIIWSMTREERRNPKVINGSRRKRIAAGSGTSVQQVNRLLKQHRQMSGMVKKMGRKGMAGLLGGRMPPGVPSFPLGR